MSGVDDRIVSMQFDNANFERKMADTLKSLDNLKKSLDFSAAKQNLGELDAAGKNFNLSGMASAVEGVSGKFLALTTVAVTALATITSHAVMAGVNMVKSFTFSPIMDGLHEFETNMGSIQTILANTKSKGSTLDDVNKSLAELNAYSDKTIYNFTEMAKNIGTFTAAGIDLDKSTQAIKGIANLAAVSGSNSEQASTAMYQLSQAMASGTVKLMDWNSVVNAGMGGEVFQKALFETGKQMKTIADVPMGQTFEEWKKAGNTFRDSLKDGWLTADVLTQTLSQFTGDLTDAQLKSVGYNDEQIKQIQEMAQTANKAATEVKTFSQLTSTVKEAIGSGWTQTFQILLGNFDEAKSLFTELGTTITSFVGDSAKARNDLLQGWKDLGGRDVLISGLKASFASLMSVIQPIKDAFHNMFPPATAQQLFDLTERFTAFMQALRLTGHQQGILADSADALFGLLKTGWTIVKELAGFIGDLMHQFSGAGGAAGGLIDGLAGMIIHMNYFLVEGGGIHKFFEGLSRLIQNPIGFIKDLTNSIIEFFKGFANADTAGEVVGRLGSRFDGLRSVVTTVIGAFAAMWDRLEGIRNALGTVFGYIHDWFAQLGHNIAQALKPGDFDSAVDAVNVGLLGGIAILLKKFLNNGINVDFGGGMMEKIKGALDGLTNSMKAMQTNLKAQALIKIAAAVGILTASVVVLSMIDSAALTKALTALTVGFGQLVGAMKLLDTIASDTKGAAKLGVLSTAMIGMAAAATILSVAVKNLSSLSWSELAKGLGGVVVMLTALTASTNLIASDTSGMIRAGVAMTAMAVALNVLALAVKSFAEMSWGEMAKGLTGVGVGLGLLVVGMNAMPVEGMISAGVGITLVATGLRILANAMQAFATMSWGEMAKGLVAVAGSLTLIALGMTMMPPNLPITAAGLVLVGVALNGVAVAMKIMGSMNIAEIGKSLLVLAGAMTVLAIGLNVMNGTLAGSAALLVAAGALGVLAVVMTGLGKVPIAQLVTGLAAIAAVLTVLGLAALIMEPVVPALLALGAALALIGGSFALFGLGAMLVAKSFEVMAKAGKAGIQAVVDAIKIFLTAVPGFAEALVKSVANSASDLLKAGTLLLKIATVFVSQILDTVITLVPKIAQAFGEVVVGVVQVLNEKFPLLVEAGFNMIMSILQGINDHILEIIDKGVEILQNLAIGLSQNMQSIVDSVTLIVTSFLDALSNRIGDIVSAGVNLLINFLIGIANNINKVIETVTLVIEAILTQIASSILQIVEAGLSILVALLQGISDNIDKVVNAVGDIITKFITTVADNYQKVIDAGFEALKKFLSGMGDNLIEVTNMVGTIITKFISAVGDKATDIANAGLDALVKFLKGMSDNIQKAIDAGKDLIIKFIEGMGKAASDIADAALRTLVTFLNNLDAAIVANTKDLQDAGKRIVGHIIDGMTFGLAGKVGGVLGKAFDLGKSAVNYIAKGASVSSPSTATMAIGNWMIDGMRIGLSKIKPATTAAESAGQQIANAVQKYIPTKAQWASYYTPPKTVADKIHDALNYFSGKNPLSGYSKLHPIQPVVKPILDTTTLEEQIKNWAGWAHIGTDTLLMPNESRRRAHTISKTHELVDQGHSIPPPPAEVTFVQNNYAPESLSTNDIYRLTKSQLALAKEELNI